MASITLSIWRSSHLLLAVTSALFLVVASVTGAILAFEPISQNAQSHAISGLDDINLNETLIVLQNEYDEVLDLEITASNFVKASVITKTGTSEHFYINPITGKKIADIKKRLPFFNWVTSLHRSLFLKGIGRFFVGLVSLLLLLIAVTGLLLLIKRRGGILKLYGKVNETEFNERYHIILGRWLLIPIIIIAMTGVFLSAEKFSLLPKTNISHDWSAEMPESFQKKDISEFELLKNISLDDLRKITFPFSDDPEDYYQIELKDKELLMHQYNGEIISEAKYPFVLMASQLSLKLHTGQGSTIWSLILFISSLSLLFFIYSGFVLSLKRIKKSKALKQELDKDACDIIILVGSETGNTFVFAKAFYKALIKAGKKVFLSSLNSYTTYNKATHLVVFTSTYGDGIAPNNANNFEAVFGSVTPVNTMHYSVVGFGSKLYPNYCSFAIKTDALLQNSKYFTPLLPLVKINEQSQSQFDTWVKQWSAQTHIALQLKNGKKKTKNNKFKVLERTPLNTDDTFLLELKTKGRVKFKSGDLLSIIPENSTTERLYSVAEVNKKVLLSIKKHELGVCSSQLSTLCKKNSIKATIKQNDQFHLPENSKDVVMIANGTGIAPFLGMINCKRKQTNSYLFWGGRTKESLQLYSNHIDKALNNNTLSEFFVSYSQEDSKKEYVQDLISEKSDLIVQVLKNDGFIMICGSLAMLQGVTDVLENITTSKLNQPLSVYMEKNQIKTDCY